jgi:hypothetical protein
MFVRYLSCLFVKYILKFYTSNTSLKINVFKMNNKFKIYNYYYEIKDIDLYSIL